MGRKKKPPTNLQLKLARRLRAIQQEMGKTDEQMGRLLGISRSRWSNWIAGLNKPEEEKMILLSDLAHIPLDWLYKGVPDRLAIAQAIRLTARLHGIDPDAAEPAAMEEMAKVAARRVD